MIFASLIRDFTVLKSWSSRKESRARHAGPDAASRTYWNHWIPAWPSSRTRSGTEWRFEGISNFLRNRQSYHAFTRFTAKFIL